MLPVTLYHTMFKSTAPFENIESNSSEPHLHRFADTKLVFSSIWFFVVCACSVHRLEFGFNAIWHYISHIHQQLVNKSFHFWSCFSLFLSPFLSLALALVLAQYHAQKLLSWLYCGFDDCDYNIQANQSCIFELTIIIIIWYVVIWKPICVCV